MCRVCVRQENKWGANDQPRMWNAEPERERERDEMREKERGASSESKWCDESSPAAATKTVTKMMRVRKRGGAVFHINLRFNPNEKFDGQMCGCGLAIPQNSNHKPLPLEHIWTAGEEDSNKQRD